MSAEAPEALPAQAWVAIGSEPVVQRLDGEPFAEALRAIDDFQGGTAPGTGTTTRWVRLEVEDEEGRRASAFREITIVNTAPVVTLGEALRIAPGGQWWTGTGTGLDAVPWPVRVEVGVTDAEGDDALIFQPGYEARWQVRGSLAAILDTDGDLFVDEMWIEDGGRAVVFDAPILPTTGELTVLISDVAGAAPNASAAVRVDVLSSTWVAGVGVNLVSRIDDARWRRHAELQAVPEEMRVLGGGGSEVLVSWNRATEFGLRVLDRFGDTVADLSLGADDRFSTRLARAIRSGDSWWIYGEGVLWRVRRNGSLLELHNGNVVCPPNPLADCDFPVNSLAIAPIAGSQDIWALQNAPPRFLRITTSGAIVVDDEASFADDVSRIASDGAGGVWISGPSDVRHRRSDGVTEVVSYPPGTSFEYAPSVGFEPRTETLWLRPYTLDRDHRVFRRDRTGVWTAADVPATSSGLEPSANGLIMFTTGGFLLYDSETLQPRAGIAITGRTGVAVLDGGTVVTSTAAPGAAEGDLHWISPELATSRIDVFTLDLPVREGIAYDPATGEIWLADRPGKRVHRVGVDGALIASVEIDTPEPIERLAIAIDPILREVWAAYMDDSNTGMLVSFGADDEEPVPVPAMTDAGPVTVTLARDLDVQPGGAVCVGASPSLRYDPASATVATTTESVGGLRRAVADPIDGACWFQRDVMFISSNDTFLRLDAQGDSLPYEMTIDSYTPGVSEQLYPSSALAGWSPGVLFSASRHVGGTSDLPLYGFHDPALGVEFQPVADFPSLAGAESIDRDEVIFFAADPPHRHFYLSVPGAFTVFRLDAAGREVGRHLSATAPNVVVP